MFSSADLVKPSLGLLGLGVRLHMSAQIRAVTVSEVYSFSKPMASWKHWLSSRCRWMAQPNVLMH